MQKNVEIAISEARQMFRNAGDDIDSRIFMHHAPSRKVIKFLRKNGVFKDRMCESPQLSERNLKSLQYILVGDNKRRCPRKCITIDYPRWMQVKGQ